MQYRDMLDSLDGPNRHMLLHVYDASGGQAKREIRFLAL